MSTERRRLGPVTLVAAATSVVSLVAACGDDDPAVAELHVVAGGTDDSAGSHEYRFEMPDEAASGPTRVSLANEGGEAHHAQLFRLDDGATGEDLVEALAQDGPPGALEVGEYVGGTALVAPGEVSQADAVVDLEPGNFVFLCLVEAADGEPHVAHGMLHPFTVDESAAPPPAPEADLSVELVDYGFELPATIDGDALLEVTNHGRRRTARDGGSAPRRRRHRRRRRPGVGARHSCAGHAGRRDAGPAARRLAAVAARPRPRTVRRRVQGALA